MTDHVARLRAALAGRYTIERELGRGGMATVYLARDVKHDRPVALKVLRPELAAILGAERFLREIRIAARLQHPNILPLYDSGDAQGMLYYVMPYVEGESLRDRLTREGPVPLEDAIRIAGDVAEALSYAHAHDVVHRDIKPENILLEGDRAVVADFGIARAVTAAGGDRLTETGIAVGTPVYMSPEQASAEPRIDGRSDIYGLGCVMYEMLAGHPPFTGTTAQEVLARHSMDAVPSLRAARRAVPEAVEAAIGKALAKAPADRFATASQFAEAISGRPERAPLAHLLRTAALFGLASVAVLGVVYALMIAVGLPDWVLGGAIVLLLLGLPVVSVTGLVERRRALASAGESPQGPSSGGLQAWLSWRRAILGGVFAFSGLGLVTSVYMTMRLLGIGPVGTLLASGVLKEREPLLLANVVNHTADSTLGTSLTEALRIDLSQSPTLRLFDTQAVAEALERMQREPGTPLELVLAREVAEREGIKVVVAGRIDPVGRGYVLSATLVTAADGRTLATVGETAENQDRLINAMGRVSRKLRERIGESFTTIRASEPLARVTTGSLEALRKYSAGALLSDAGEWDRAIPLLKEAIALDTGFAMAYRKLGVALENSGSVRAQRVAAATQAFEHRDRLPEVERQLVIAWYYDHVEGDPEKVVAAYRAALERQPDNGTALNNLSFELIAQRRFVEAESLALRTIAVAPLNANPYVNAAEAQSGLGRYADAVATLDRYPQTSPSNPLIRDFRALVASAQGDYTTADRELHLLREEQHSSPSWKASTSYQLAVLSRVRGLLAESARHLRDHMATSEERGIARDYLIGAMELAALDLGYRNRPVEALKTVETALQRYPLASIAPVDRPYPQLAMFYAQAGRIERAKHFMVEFASVVPEGVRRGIPARYAAAGAIALGEGRLDDAIAAYRQRYADGEDTCLTCGLYELAMTFERAHRPDSALAAYRRIVSTPGVTLVLEDYHNLAPTYKRLGELYEARGERANALESYRRFVDLWRNADPELQPQVAGARAALRRLGGR